MDDHAPAMVHEALVGLYPCITVSKATETRPLSQYLAAIRANTWQDQIESLRAIPPEDEKARQAIKKALAYITWTGTFTRRAKDALLLHSGVILGDIDKLTDFLTARALLEADPFTFFCFQSPSGNGLKVAMVCPPVTTDEDYKRYWTAAAEYHATRYGITWDPSGKDISRACFVSYDPAIYWNIEPLVMPEPELLHRLTPHLGALGDAEDGELHSTRNKTAYTVGGLVSAGTLPEQPCLDLLQAMAASKSSDPANARREIQRSFTDGMQKPLRGSNGRRRSQPYNGTAHDHGILNDELDPTEADPALAPFIPLPGKLQPKAELAATACQWLDDYITYSQRWSPRSAPLLHEAVAIWLLSVIAAGRVRIDLGPSHITTVMIAICAPSSVYAKSTTVNLGIRLLGATGLSALLHADESTPQALLKSMAKPPIPEEFFVLPEMERATITTRAAFAGQRSWFYEEWGQQLKQMQRSDGPMALLHGLLRRLDDGRLSHASDTIARGREEVNDPYLSLISNCTPTDLAPYCGPGHAYWHDGLWARFAFIGAGEATPSRARLPRRHRFQIPASLVKGVRGWHAYLGIPDVQIVNDDEEKKKSPAAKTREKKGQAPRAIVTRREPHHPPISDAIYDAYDAYDDAMATLGQQLPDDWHSSYARYHTRAARIAALLSSMDYYTRVGDLKGAKIERPIELTHWHRAVAIVERWRASHHQLMAHIHTLDYTPPTAQAKLEQRLLKLIQRQPPTTRAMRNATRKSYEEVGRALTTLERADVIEKVEQGKTVVYRLRV